MGSNLIKNGTTIQSSGKAMLVSALYAFLSSRTPCRGKSFVLNDKRGTDGAEILVHNLASGDRLQLREELHDPFTDNAGNFWTTKVSWPDMLGITPVAMPTVTISLQKN